MWSDWAIFKVLTTIFLTKVAQIFLALSWKTSLLKQKLLCLLFENIWLLFIATSGHTGHNRKIRILIACVLPNVDGWQQRWCVFTIKTFLFIFLYFLNSLAYFGFKWAWLKRKSNGFFLKQIASSCQKRLTWKFPI